MNFEIFETERLLLKAISPEEMTRIFESLPKSEIKKILGHRTDEAYYKEENKYKNGYSSYNRRFKLFLLTDKTTDSIIGRCGLHNWNTEHSRSEVGYVMEDVNFQNKGLMTEALKLIIAHGFNVLNLNRIEALVGIENFPSRRLMEKFNFIQEGILRQHHFINGTYEDSIIFSKLAEEFRIENS